MAVKIDNFTDLFVFVYKLWPPEIDISGYKIEGPILPLVKIVDELKPVGESLGYLIDASIWPFHQALFDLAAEAIEEGRGVIYPRNVSMIGFRNNLEKALRDPSWNIANSMFSEIR